MFLMMSVGCMQILVGQRHRHAEKMGCDFGPRTLNPSPILKPVTYFGNHPFLRLTGPRVYMIVHRRGFVPSSAPRDPSFARWGDFGRLRRPSRRSRPRHIIRHYLQLLERPNVSAVSGGTPRTCPTHCRGAGMPSGDLCHIAPRGGSPHMISVTELVQIAATARSTGFGTFSGSLGSAKSFRRGPRGARYERFEGSNFRTVKLLRIAYTTATKTTAVEPWLRAFQRAIPCQLRTRWR